MTLESGKAGGLLKTMGEEGSVREGEKKSLAWGEKRGSS